MNKALFEVGEEVRTCWADRPGYPNYDRIKIVAAEWQENERCRYPSGHKNYTGWCYLLADGTPEWADECYLRKIPPLAGGSFDQLIKELNTPVTEECTG